MKNLNKEQKARFKQALKGTGLRLIDFECEDKEDFHEFRVGNLNLQRGIKNPKKYTVGFGWRHTEYNYELRLTVNGKTYLAEECITTQETEVISELMSIIKPHNKWAKKV